MSRATSISLPSLLDHFDPPENYTGEFGWICGFSADAPFVNEAAERFTGLSTGQRAAEGQIQLVLMLDPSQQALLPTMVPGVAHLPLRDLASKPFRLLHAKVALMGYRHKDDPSIGILRLVVSTGNWTRQTVEDSLDLAWRTELDDADRRSVSAAPVAHADFAQAARFFDWLLGLHDTRLLDGLAPCSAQEAAQRVRDWLKACRKQPAYTSQFMDSRKQSLMDQIEQRLSGGSESLRRSYLAMGSGFYEAPAATPGDSCPLLPHVIVKRLKRAGVLGPRSVVELFVNPQACQAIASAVIQLGDHPDHAIQVRKARAPQTVFGEGSQRSLHAKFLFSAGGKGAGGKCSHAWLYLGSGNITPAGLMLAAAKDKGNLEAGVMLFPKGLSWDDVTNPSRAISNLLPIGGDPLAGDLFDLQPGDALPALEVQHVSSPIAYLQWDGEGLLRIAGDAPADVAVDVLDSTDAPCARSADGFRWVGPAPRIVRIRWIDGDTTQVAHVPVVDPHGRVAATPLPAIELDHAWTQLACFPLPPEREEDDPSESHDGDRDGRNGKDTKRSASAVAHGTSIRQMMTLIEQVALRQTTVYAADWPRWCNRLEQTLGQARECDAVAQFIKMQLNPLSPLRAPAFRPSFAEDDATPAGKLYQAALDRIELAWRTHGLAPLGGAA